MTGILQYKMAALVISSPIPQMTYWFCQGAPDFDGYQSNWPPSALQLPASIIEALTIGGGEDFNVPTGPASGDLSGQYPNPTVVGIQGFPVANTAPTNGQVLAWDSADGYYAPAAAGGGGSSITWAADLLGSTNSSQTVVGINGIPITVGPTANNQVPVYNSSSIQWAGLTGDLQITGGIGVGTYIVTGLQGIPIGAFYGNGLLSYNGSQISSTGSPSYGDMLYWNGSQWQYIGIGSEGQVLTVSGGAPQWV